MFIETEATPNPATLKFLPQRVVMAAGTRDFADAEAAAASPLAEALFSLGDVARVFFGKDFIAVTAGEGADWSALKGQVVAVLLDHFVSDAPLFVAQVVPGPTPDAAGHAPEDAEIVAQILDLIETRIRPAVANDGGDVQYRSYRDGVVTLAMQGACSGCPSSTATLKHGIESLIRYYVPEVTEVRAA